MDRVRWGIVGPGAIGETFARGLAQSKTGILHAVASRDVGRARAFASSFGAESAYGSYEALLQDPHVEAVYIATPHPLHREWAVLAAQAGKHLLVEKPIAMNANQAEAIVHAARESGVFLMEAYMYRCHPQTVRLVEIIRSGVIGDVLAVDACFSFQSAFNGESRAWKKALGGGAILDIGGYVVSMARLVAGAATGLRFADPDIVQGVGVLHPETGVDGRASALLKFPGGFIATVHAGIDIRRGGAVRVFGTTGSIQLDEPWLCRREGRQDGLLVVEREDGSREVEAISLETTSFACEADVCGRSIRAGFVQPDHPTAMTWDDTLGNMRTLDAWRQRLGLVYEGLE